METIAFEVVGVDVQGPRKEEVTQHSFHQRCIKIDSFGESNSRLRDEGMRPLSGIRRILEKESDQHIADGGGKREALDKGAAIRISYEGL